MSDLSTLGAMVDTATMGKLLQRFAQGVAADDRENPGHHSWGIGMAQFDIERLGFDAGEEVLPGIVLQADGGVTGNFRVSVTETTTARASSRRRRSSTPSPPRRSPSRSTPTVPRRSARLSSPPR